MTRLLGLGLYDSFALIGPINKATGQPSTKNYCIVNGKWRKYEPIFLFYKT